MRSAPGVRSIVRDRVADVHVEVPVDVAVGVGCDLLAEEDAGAVAGDVELGDPVAVARGVAAAGALQAGQGDGEVFGAGVLETTWVSPVTQVAVIDRDVAGFVVAARREPRGRAEDEVFAVGGEVFGDVAVGLGRGSGVERAAMPCTSSPSDVANGMPV